MHGIVIRKPEMSKKEASEENPEMLEASRQTPREEPLETPTIMVTNLKGAPRSIVSALSTLVWLI